MPSGFSNQPKILRGAFVEFGVSPTPLIVVFQFNPETITRTHTLSLSKSGALADTKPTQSAPLCQSVVSQPTGAPPSKSGFFKSLIEFRAGQTFIGQPETLSLDIRLDATDKLNEGDEIVGQFGIAPQLATLELMMLPKNQQIAGRLLSLASSLVGLNLNSFAFFDAAKNPPIILFVWGRQKVLAVNITSMRIQEQEFNTELNPIRATVSASLEVIEGCNLPYLYTNVLKETMAILNLRNIRTVTNTVRN